MLFTSPIYEDNQPILYETRHNSLFSVLKDSAFNKVWEPWEPKYFAIRKNATMVYRNHRDSSILAKFDLQNVKISKLVMPYENPLLKKEFGIMMTCQLEGLDTCIRFILDEEEMYTCITILKQLVPSICFDSDILLPSIRPSTLTSSTSSSSLLFYPTTTATSSSSSSSSSQYFNQSVMRQSFTKAIDAYNLQSKYDRIIKRRGAFGYLPVYFDNDLIHGSWWFVIGSVLIVICSMIILYNSYYPTLLGTDDSDLNDSRYQAVWWCILISGLFFTIGSLCFVRAMYETPPMRPLFSWYHISNDELLGAWFFLFGSLPGIPYCFVYMITDQTISYFGAFICAIILNIGMFFFVLTCYPNTVGKVQNNYVYTLSMYIYHHLCCVLSSSELSSSLPFYQSADYNITNTRSHPYHKNKIRLSTSSYHHNYSHLNTYTNLPPVIDTEGDMYSAATCMFSTPPLQPDTTSSSNIITDTNVIPTTTNTYTITITPTTTTNMNNINPTNVITTSTNSVIKCGCITEEFINKHLGNDWLASCWIIFWGNVLSIFALLVWVIDALIEMKWLPLFVYGSTLIEAIIFVIGSAYFVAGSYPLDNATSAVTHVPSSTTTTTTNNNNNNNNNSGNNTHNDNNHEQVIKNKDVIMSASRSNQYRIPLPMYEINGHSTFKKYVNGTMNRVEDGSDMTASLIDHSTILALNRDMNGSQNTDETYRPPIIHLKSALSN